MATLFTIVCEFKGGTYTKQLQTESPVQAFARWADLFSEEDILTAAEKKAFSGEVDYALSNDNLVALEGMQNIWYEGFSLKDDLLEVIIIAMSEQPVAKVPEQAPQKAGV